MNGPKDANYQNRGYLLAQQYVQRYGSVPRVKSAEVLETDRLIGQCLGAGMSVEKTAEHVGVAPNTVRNHLDGANKQFIFKVKAEVEAICAKTLAREVESLEEKYKRLRPKAIDKLEQLVGSDKDGVALGAVREALDRTEGKPVNRTVMLGQVEHQHSHSLSDETLARLDALQNKLLPKALPVIDVSNGSDQRD